MVEVTEDDCRTADAIAAMYGWSRASDQARERVATHRIAAEQRARDAVLDEAAGIVDQLNREGPYCAIGAASVILAAKDKT